MSSSAGRMNQQSTVAEESYEEGSLTDEEDTSSNSENEDITQTDSHVSSVDVKHADNLVWLAKVPIFLLEKWQSAKPDTLLGQMHEHKSTSGEISSITMHLSASDSARYEVPKDYELNFAPVALSTHIFTEDRRLRARTIEGHVESEATVKVTNLRDPYYRQIMRQRMVAQRDKRPGIKMMNESESNQTQRVIPQKTGGVSLSLQNRRVKSSINERIPKEELIEFLFGLFEQYAKWNMKGLKEKTKQPTVYPSSHLIRSLLLCFTGLGYFASYRATQVESWLKEILGEIAFYHRKGEYRGCYELLPEYQQSHQAAQEFDPAQSRQNASQDQEGSEEDEEIFEDA